MERTKKNKADRESVFVEKPVIIREGNTLVVQCEPEESEKLENLVSEMREARIASIIDVINR